MCLSAFISASKCVLVFVCLFVRHTTREGILTLNNDSSISPNPFSSLPIYLTIVFSLHLTNPIYSTRLMTNLRLTHFTPFFDICQSPSSLPPPSFLPRSSLGRPVGGGGWEGAVHVYVINRRDRMSKLNASLTPPSVQFACSINRLITWSILPYEWLPYSTLCRSVDVPLPLPLYPSSAAVAAPDAVSRERLHLS